MKPKYELTESDKLRYKQISIMEAISKMGG